MKCDKCGKDKNAFSELYAIPRKDNTSNCYSMFHPVRPRKQLICGDCFGFNDKPGDNK